MNKSLKNILFFLIVFILLDNLAGIFLSQSFTTITFGTFGKINTSLKTNADVVILGSSRAMYHYDPNIIFNKTDYSCFNSGLGGYGLFYNFALLSESIKIHIPKIVILDLSPNVINDKKSYEKLNLFMPYTGKYRSFSELIQLDPNYHFLSRASNLYKYNSTLFEQFRNLTSKPKNTDGFLGLTGTIDTLTFSAFYYDHSPLDTNKLFYFKEIIKICNDNDIRLICLISPTYIKYDTSNEIIHKYNAIANTNNVEYIDHSSLQPFHLNPNYFKDQLHLNNHGATKYSEVISNYIIQDRSNN